jgi:hypothetical protein
MTPNVAIIFFRRLLHFFAKPTITASGERVTPEIVAAASKTYTARLVLDQHAVRRPGNVYEYFGPSVVLCLPKCIRFSPNVLRVSSDVPSTNKTHSLFHVIIIDLTRVCVFIVLLMCRHRYV